MTCPACGTETLLIYENGGRYDFCPQCGHITERTYNVEETETHPILPEVFDGVEEELKRDDLLP